MKRSVLIKSCKGNKLKVEACQLWANELRKHDIPVYSVTGGWIKESVFNNDIQVTSDDSYRDIGEKVKHALRIVLAIDSFTHLFIVDDDTFIHPRRWLDHIPIGEFECFLHYPRDKFEEGINKGRPWASGGGGWWMSRRCCELYVRMKKGKENDDVAAARFVQDKKIRIYDRPDLYAQWGERVSESNRLITCHYVSPEEMRRLYEESMSCHNIL